MKKSIKDRLAFASLLLLEKIPLSWHKTIGNFLGYLFLAGSKTRRNTAYQQLKIAFPHWNKKKIKQTAFANTQSLGLAVLETISKQSYEKKWTNWVENKHQEELAKVKNSGAIFFSGHFANWELGTIALDKTGLKGIFIGSAKNLLAKKILQRYRKSKNWENGFREDTSLPFKIVKHLKKKQSLYMLLDLDYNVENVMCDFFGQKTRCPTSVAKIAVKYQKPVIACLNHREKARHIFHYRTISSPPYKPNISIQELSQKYTKVLEEHIKQYPKQWNWSEPRWKKERWTHQDN